MEDALLGIYRIAATIDDYLGHIVESLLSLSLGGLSLDSWSTPLMMTTTP